MIIIMVGMAIGAVIGFLSAICLGSGPFSGIMLIYGLAIFAAFLAAIVNFYVNYRD